MTSLHSSDIVARLAACALVWLAVAPATRAQEAPDDGSFGAQSAKLRDPFWPPGYEPGQGDDNHTPARPATPMVNLPRVEPPRWEEARATLAISGISRVSPEECIAFINGRFVQQGEEIEVSWKGRTYRWRIREIREEGVRLQELDVRKAGTAKVPSEG